MKKITFLFVFITNVSFAQPDWGPDTKITQIAQPAFCLNHAKSMAVCDSAIHLVWSDSRDGIKNEVYYKRSLDGGDSWEPEIRLTNDAEYSEVPCVATDSFGGVHIVWSNRMSDSEMVWYIHSSDFGNTWDSVQVIAKIQKTSNFLRYPVLVCNDSTVYIFWSDDRTGKDEIYYRRSTDGETWDSAVCLTQIDTMASMYPSVALDDSGNIHLAWREQKTVSNFGICYKRTLSGGWSQEVELTDSGACARMSCLVSYENSIHVVWSDDKGAGSDSMEIYYARSLDRGINWETVKRLTYATKGSYSPALACDGLGRVHLVWQDERDNAWTELYYKYSPDGGQSWESDIQLTNADGFSITPCLAFSKNKLHLVWKDGRDGNPGQVYYKRGEISIAAEETERPIDKIRISQNPFRNSIRVYGAKGKIEIYDLTGKLVGVAKDEVGKNLRTGVYFLKIPGHRPEKVVKLR